jgi:hypothetical protein
MKKIKELLIEWDNIDFEELGVDIMSLVDKPAIQTTWLAFAEEHFVEPTAGESEDEFIGRCIPKLLDEGYSQDQAAAICYSYYQDRQSECTSCTFSDEEYILTEEQEKALLELAEEFGEEVDYREVIEIDLTQKEFNTIGDFVKGVTALDILGKRVKKDEPAVTKYRYAGPPAQRNFCKAMLRMQKLYTKDEINQMSFRGINNSFGHNGNNYSIFKYKGGVNCAHYWEELLVFKGSNDQTIMISKGPAEGDAGERAGASNNYWRFASEEEQIVVGPAMIPNKLILRKDELGNPYHVYFSKETIKKIAKKFLEQSNHNNTDINHNDEVVTQNTLLESWIVEDPEKDKSAVYGFGVPEGTWMVSYKINDTNTWNKIKAGELNGFSVTGNFIEKLQ